jgi:hypothetical protein
MDRSVMQIKFSESLRKTSKRYKKLFFHIIDLLVLNSYILFKTMKHQNFQLSKFKLEIIRELIAKCGSKKSHVGKPLSGHPLQLTARHVLSLVSPNESNQT